jgi:dienelactone hydrolase
MVARFEPGDGALPSFLDVPYPSDVYLDPDGTIADEIPGLSAYIPNAEPFRAALAAQRGFGVNTGAVFRVDHASGPTEAEDAPVVDAASLPADEAASIADASSVFLLDLDAGTRVPARVVFHDDRPQGSPRAPVLAVMPARGVVLAEGHRHAAVLTTAVTAGGKSIGPSAAFRAIRDGEARGTALEKLHGAAVDRAAQIVPALADLPRVAAVAVFTTQAVSDELVEMRALTAQLKAPALSWVAQDLAPMGLAIFGATAQPGYAATLDDWLGTPAKLPDGSDDPAADQSTGAAHDALAVIGTAVFQAPNFLLRKAAGYTDPAHANVARDAAGKPAINADAPTSKIWVTLALPRAPMPKKGFPLVILQHGLGGDRSFLLALANTYAKEGWATAAIESCTFGARAASAADAVDAVSTFGWSGSAKYAGPDGFVDHQASPIAFFGTFADFGAPRDQLRQSVVDVGALADALASPELDLGPLLAAVPGAKLDTSRIGYVGDSFGSIMGSMVAAVEPRIGAFVLNVGGGGIVTELVANAPSLGSLVGSVGALVLGVTGDRLDASHPAAQILQSILDPADPLTHARRMAAQPATLNGALNAPKSVVLIEALWDELVANEGGEALARVGGLSLATPNVGSNAGVPLAEAKPGADGLIRGAGGVTTVLVQASPATHGGDFYNARGSRSYAIPFAQPGAKPFPALPVSIPVREPYLGLQAMSVGFLRGYFAGETPPVGGFPAPRRDFDDDGVDDTADADPADPGKQ